MGIESFTAKEGHAPETKGVGFDKGSIDFDKLVEGPGNPEHTTVGNREKPIDFDKLVEGPSDIGCTPFDSKGKGIDFDKLVEGPGNPEHTTVGNREKPIDFDKLVEGPSSIEPIPTDSRENSLDIGNRFESTRLASEYQNKFERLGIPETKELFSTLEERMKNTPRGDGTFGTWIRDGINFKYIPNDLKAKEVLAKCGEIGVAYINGMPDFSPFAEASVQISDMSDKRQSNFGQADTACAEYFNEVTKDGKTNWMSADVKTWRRENNYSWHECSDMKTCLLVPEDIHKPCKHMGGVCEYKKREGITGGFDA